MARSIKSVKSGQDPGTLVHVGEQKTREVTIQLFDYTRTSFEEKFVKDIKECFHFKNRSTVTWINISGLHDSKIIEAVGKYFGVHALILEDILNTEQRPKTEYLEDYAYVVMKILQHKKRHYVDAEQISILLGKNVVITFLEDGNDVFEGIKDRLRKSKGRVRDRGSGYLAYLLIDAIVDQYFAILESLGDEIEKLEDELTRHPSEKALITLKLLRREIIYLRRSIWPARDVINALMRDEGRLMHGVSSVYLRDVYDHAVQAMDSVETYRDILAGLQDIYLSTVSNKMNEVMKVLTVIATIFIPLTFITGIYGMNFQNMPELGWQNGYFYTLGVMAILGIGMAIYFKHKKWI